MRNSIILIILIFLLNASCKEFVTSDFPDTEPKVTVNGILHVGDTLRLHLSLSGKIDSQKINFVDDATIDLFIDDKFSEQLIYSGKGNYISKEIVMPNKKYSCKVTVPGFSEVNCSQTIPDATEIIKMENMPFAGKDEYGYPYSSVKITFTNNLNNKKYYEIAIRKGYFHTFTDPVLLYEGLPLPLFSNEIIDDTMYTLTLNYTAGISNYPTNIDTLPFMLELRSVSYDYYCFKKQYYLYEKGTWADGLINMGTAVPLHSNIENGNGIFAGYSSYYSNKIASSPNAK
jgi:hypothetical protein